MSEITTQVQYNPRLTFDAWAKNLIELPQEHRIGYTRVTASVTLNNNFVGKSWKINPTEKAMIDLVRAAVAAYGMVLEDKHFYFDRKIEHRQSDSVFTVTLYVAER